MALTQNDLDYVINPAFDRIAVKTIALTDTSKREYGYASRYYEKTRDELLRSFTWNFARKRATLYPVQTLVLDREPTPSAWAVGDTITGLDSLATGIVLAVNTNVSYEITGDDTDFTAGETITNGTVTTVTYLGDPVYDGDDLIVTYTADDEVNCGSSYPTQSDTTPAYRWTYQYKLPSDYIRLLSVYEDDGLDHPVYRYSLEQYRIVTDYSTMNILYIYQVTDPTLFSPLFLETLILRLAKKFVIPLKGAKQDAFVADVENDLARCEARARVIDEQEANATGYNDYLYARYNTE